MTAVTLVTIGFLAIPAFGQGQGVAGSDSEHVYAFSSESGGDLWVNQWDGSVWSSSNHGSPGLPAASAPAAIAFQEAGINKVYAFMTARNHHLYVRWYDGAAWHWADQGTPPGAQITGSPAAAVYLAGGIPHIYVFVRGGDGHVYVNWWDGSLWNWADLGAPANGVRAISTPDAIVFSASPLNIYAFVAGDDGAAHTVWWNGVAWNWSTLGAPPGVQLASTPSAVSFLDTAVTPRVRKLYVFWAADNGHLYINGLGGDRWSWYDQGVPPGTTVDSSPRALGFFRSDTSFLNAFVVGRDRHLYTNWWDGHRWSWADQGVSDARGLVGASVVTSPLVLQKSLGTVVPAPATTTMHVLFERADHRIHANVWDGSAWLTMDARSPRAGYARMDPLGPMVTADVSPRTSGPAPSPGSDTGGRIVSSAISPVRGPDGGETIFVAAAYSGVWKSSDSGNSWHQSSSGLTTGATAPSNRALAIDPANPSQLLYAASDSDYRVTGRSRGGLWVTVSAGTAWRHVDLPGCPSPGITEVGFGGNGRAFVLSMGCGAVYTSTDLRSDRSDSWTRLTLPGGLMVQTISAHQQSVFACAGSSAFRGAYSPAGLVWEAPIALPGACSLISALPATGTSSPAALVEYGTSLGRDLALVNFVTRSAPLSLGFANSVTRSHDCCGTFGIFPVRRNGTGPDRFDVFAADQFWFWQLGSGITPTSVSSDWSRITQDSPPLVHLDTWSVAFSPVYDGSRNCGVYATSDGGFSRRVSCSNSSWVSSNQGLHAFKSQVIAGIPRGYCSDSERHPCSWLYVPSGDNGTWHSPTGGRSDWTNMVGGDAGFASVDPGNNLVAHSDWYVWLSNDGTPPKQSSTNFHLYSDEDRVNYIGQYPPSPDPPNGYDANYWPPMGPLPQIATLRGEAPLRFGDFLSLKRPAGTSDSELIVRSCISRDGSNYSTTIRSCPSSSGASVAWTDVSPGSHFQRQSVIGIASSGGHRNTVVYVVGRLASETSPGKRIYRGAVDPAVGTVPRWEDRSNVCADPQSVRVGNPITLMVDPEHPDVAYAADGASNSVISTRDGGRCWYAEPTLTRLATADGEFNFQCSGYIGNGDRFCPLQQMLFLPDDRTRFALLFPGGLALSRDSGATWRPISDRLLAQPELAGVESIRDLQAYGISMFFDPNGIQPLAQPFGGSLYVALLGRGLIRLDVPLP